MVFVGVPESDREVTAGGGTSPSPGPGLLHRLSQCLSRAAL